MLNPPPPVVVPQGLFTGTEAQEEEDNGVGGGTKSRITCTDRSANGLVIAAGDGHSRVRLYRHPCPGDRPPPALFHELRGHGAGGVSRARFLRGGGFLVTTGESDRYEREKTEILSSRKRLWHKSGVCGCFCATAAATVLWYKVLLCALRR